MKVKVRSILRGLALVAGLAAAAEAQPRLKPPASYVQPTPPDAVEGAAILERSRNIGLSGPYYLEFELWIRPRQGTERRVAGRWFGARNASGPVTRIELLPDGEPLRVVIVQSGPKPAVWMGRKGGRFETVSGERTFEPLAGSDLSAADLQTPFMFWRDNIYEGLARFRGRPTHVFLLYPPDEEIGLYPGVGAARVFIDTAYGAISQAQWLDAAGTPTKTITILDLKRIDERWIVKSFEARSEASRNKSRFVVVVAALDLDFPEDIFDTTAEVASASFEVPPERMRRVR